jgi:MFS family permease
MVRFFLYSQAGALVFGKLFFPRSDPLVGVMEAFAVFFANYVTRPIGAAIFGHFGDRIGRKKTLVMTLLMTGFGTLRWAWCRPMPVSASGAPFS